MEVIIEGSNIGISFSGLFGFILLIYLLVEIISFSTTSTSLTHKIFLFFVVRKSFKKLIPGWWNIKMISFLTISRKSYNHRCVYIEVERKLPGYKREWTNFVVEVDNFGKIINYSNLNQIKYYDRDLSEDFKLQFNRNKTLEKLGI